MRQHVIFSNIWDYLANVMEGGGHYALHGGIEYSDTSGMTDAH